MCVCVCVCVCTYFDNCITVFCTNKNTMALHVWEI